MSHIYVFKLYLAVCNIHETYLCEIYMFNRKYMYFIFQDIIYQKNIYLL